MGDGRSLLDCSVNSEVAVFCESCFADFTNTTKNVKDGRLEMSDDSSLAEAVMMYLNSNTCSFYNAKIKHNL